MTTMVVTEHLGQQMNHLVGGDSLLIQGEQEISAFTDRRKGCSCILMLRGECGTAILVEVSPERLPAAGREPQGADRQHGECSIILPARARFA
jgi:hypothetical protein